MQSRGVSFSGLAMCWSETDYSWILIVSSVVLILSAVWILFAYSQTRKDMALTEAKCSSKGAQNVILPGKSHRMEVLGNIYKNQSPICFFLEMIPKVVLVFFLIIFREEIHLQTVVILLLIPMLCGALLFYTPFRITQKGLKKSSAKSATDSAISGVGQYSTQSVTIRKHWYFNTNYLLVEGLLLFLCFYADSIIPATPLSAWRIVAEVCIILCSALCVISIVLSGIGELAFKHANAFFDVITESKNEPTTEHVILAKLQDEKMSVDSVSQRCKEIPKRGEEAEEGEEGVGEVESTDERQWNEQDEERQQRIADAIDAFGKRLSTE